MGHVASKQTTWQLSMIINPHGRKHVKCIALGHQFMQQMIFEHSMKIHQVRSSKQKVGMFTKLLKRVMFQHTCSMIQIQSASHNVYNKLRFLISKKARRTLSVEVLATRRASFLSLRALQKRSSLFPDHVLAKLHRPGKYHQNRSVVGKHYRLHITVRSQTNR